ncbi:MAG TPA: glycoside hydrolase family 36 protein [Acidimicrobiales bacterium]|nr:glycoside hydrolase family 36 protein [Acidimicrobiales bacterium]
MGALRPDVVETPTGWTWSVTAEVTGPVDRVSFTWDAGPAGRDPRMFRHGYQSWSPVDVAHLGRDVDPSSAPAPSLVRGMHHADPEPVSDAHELRSELVTVVHGDGPPVCLGFLGGTDHDGTFRVRVREGRIEVDVEAYLGGAVLRAGETRQLHGVGRFDSLEDWAAAIGSAMAARVAAPYQVGWCSWYHWFHDISEDALRAQLALAADWPFDVFQLDDGYQAAIGDWLTTNDKFPTAVDGIAAAIAAEGRTPGIWIAPFLAAPGSRLATDHPDWLARHPATGDPLRGMVNAGWGGTVWTLDTTRPEVLAHLEDVARSLVDAGFPYLKLDFTYAPSLPGTYADPGRTPAQRVRAGMEAIRRGAGDGTFLLGCGLPIAQGIGVVDGMRIGPDVAPFWDPPTQVWEGSLYAGVAPATANALRNTEARQFMHRRLWLNDPDCVMLRTTETQLTPEQVERWAMAVGRSGGMALVSDDLALLDGGSRALLDRVLATGRAADVTDPS